ncbi:MAG: CPBP family intramembrane metalloprotease [Bacteroidetes bacterium]|nr:CPBP family intramembrane metalloprotease [Bacteroidota bacterium]
MEVDSGAGKAQYLSVTKSATYGFLAALPLFALYEGLILFVNGDRISQIRVGADIWVKQMLAVIGATGMISLGIAVLIIGIVVFVVERKKRIPIRPRYLGWMIGESALYAVVVAFLVSSLVGMMFSSALGLYLPGMIQDSASGQPGQSMMLVLSIGAGLYEELIFRVVMVGGLFWVLNQWMGKRRLAYVIAALIGAIIFSAVHYIGPLGDPFTMSSFNFRFIFGLALNVIFLVRGFGVAAWTHALYDVLVVSHLLG